MDIEHDVARSIAYHTVVDWLCHLTGIPGSDIDVSKKFDDDGLTDGTYLSMCNDVVATANRATGHGTVLDGQWRPQAP